jgi:hypothetical protein
MSVDQPVERIEHSDDTEGDADSTGSAELAAQLEVLTEENQRLREEYSRARRTEYRRTAVGLVGVGVIAVLGGLTFPDAQNVLFALAGTGIFAGMLTYYLNPEQFMPVSIGDGIYASLSNTGAAIANELGLQDTHVYVPAGEDVSGETSVRLFVPQHAGYELPNDTDFNSVFVVTGTERARGVAFHPTGLPLFREFERALSAELRTDLEGLATQLIDGLVEQFELVESATPDIDPDGDRVSIGITSSAYGAVDQFDHPVASFLGVGFATGTNRAITVEVMTADQGRVDYFVTCSLNSKTE